MKNKSIKRKLMKEFEKIPFKKVTPCKKQNFINAFVRKKLVGF